ncbi:MAG: hypothetical protein DI547_00035 [Sphingobium sp.]|nr:MAG: hypothetical protein DI547_00035 [Sphingobium sp.]
MVRHVVIFSWRPECDAGQIERFKTALCELAHELRALVSIDHGPDLSYRDGNGDYGLVAAFADRAAWDAYQAHPKHKAFVHDFVTPIQASRLTIQFEGVSAA